MEGLFAQVDLRRIALEVTEHAVVSDYGLLIEELAPYRAAGMRLVSIDDAGAGYASFRHIIRLHPDSIKIYLSLIRDIDRDLVCQSLVRSLVAFASTTNALLIAEGVETHAELEPELTSTYPALHRAVTPASDNADPEGEGVFRFGLDRTSTASQS